MERHRDALRHISANFGNRIGVFGEGLGGFVVFYLALDHGPMKSIVCQNSPGILTEEKFQRTVTRSGSEAQQRRMFLPLLRILVKLAPWLKLPTSFYIDFRKLVDSNEDDREIETRMVREGYLKDPDFDRWYPISAIMSLVSTPPPNPLTELRIPTMFLVPRRGWSDPTYVKDMYNRIPLSTRNWSRLMAASFGMVSHLKEAAELICKWFDETL